MKLLRNLATKYALLPAVFTVLFSFSARADSGLSREALFQRAFTSTAYFLTMAQLDERFMNRLTPAEKRMIPLVFDVAQAARNRQWFMTNQIQNFPTATTDRYYFAFKGGYWHREQALPAESPVRFGLEFSDDQSLFKLREGEPTRSAITEDGLDKNIFVNKALINSPTLDLSLSDAAQIMVHEFGHKLGVHKDQQAVDSLGAKLKTFLDARTSKFQTSNGEVSVLKFEQSPYEDWLETTLEGRYQGSNIPNKIEPLQIIDGEGFYVLVKNPMGTFDYTARLQNDVAALSRFKPYDGLPFQWKHLHLFQNTKVRVTEVGGMLRFDVDTQHSEAVLPFLKSGDPDPRSAQVWEKLMSRGGEVGEHHYVRSEWMAYNARGAAVMSMVLRPKIFENTQTTPRLISRQVHENDITLKFKIDHSISVPGSEREATRPYLVLSDGIFEFEVEGKFETSDPSIATFKIANANDLSGELRISHMEFEPKVRNLAKRYYFRVRTFVTNSEPLRFAKRPFSVGPTLQKVELWDGTQWLASDQADRKAGSHLRLVFDTVGTMQPIRQLHLSMLVPQFETFQTVTQLGSEQQVIAGQPRYLGDFLTTMTIPASALQQEIRDNKLYVTYAIDQETQSEFVRHQDISPAAGDQPPYGQFRVTEQITANARAERMLTGVEVISSAGLPIYKNMEKRFLYKGSPNFSPPPRGSAGRSCSRVFAGF